MAIVRYIVAMLRGYCQLKFSFPCGLMLGPQLWDQKVWDLSPPLPCSTQVSEYRILEYGRSYQYARVCSKMLVK